MTLTDPVNSATNDPAHAGKIKLVEKTEGGKEVVVKEPDEDEAYTCTDEQRKKVKELIAAYIATEPKSEQSKAAQAPAPVKK